MIEVGRRDLREPGADEVEDILDLDAAVVVVVGAAAEGGAACGAVAAVGVGGSGDALAVDGHDDRTDLLRAPTGAAGTGDGVDGDDDACTGGGAADSDVVAGEVGLGGDRGGDDQRVAGADGRAATGSLEPFEGGAGAADGGECERGDAAGTVVVGAGVDSGGLVGRRINVDGYGLAGAVAAEGALPTSEVGSRDGRRP